MLNHIAVIMDGNRRWAKKRNLLPWIGHKRGVGTIKHLIKFCLEENIKIASVYMFSLENFKRSDLEISNIFNLIIEESNNIIDDIIENEVRVSFCGDKSYFPQSVVPVIKNLEEKTKSFDKLRLIVFFCYGGQQEIINAIKKIAIDVKNNLIDPQDINKELINNYLWTWDIPEPELIIRTGGAIRLSNFLLYKSAYSELYFTKRLWPDLKKIDFKNALKIYSQRKKNFGT